MLLLYTVGGEARLGGHHARPKSAYGSDGRNRNCRNSSEKKRIDDLFSGARVDSDEDESMPVASSRKGRRLSGQKVQLAPLRLEPLTKSLVIDDEPEKVQVFKVASEDVDEQGFLLMFNEQTRQAVRVNVANGMTVERRGNWVGLDANIGPIVYNIREGDLVLLPRCKTLEELGPTCCDPEQVYIMMEDYDSVAFGLPQEQQSA